MMAPCLRIFFFGEIKVLYYQMIVQLIEKKIKKGYLFCHIFLFRNLLCIEIGYYAATFIRPPFVLLVISGIRVIRVIKLHVFTF